MRSCLILQQVLRNEKDELQKIEEKTFLPIYSPSISETNVAVNEPAVAATVLLLTSNFDTLLLPFFLSLFFCVQTQFRSRQWTLIFLTDGIKFLGGIFANNRHRKNWEAFISFCAEIFVLGLDA